MKLSRVNDQYLSGYPAFDPPVVALGVLLELLLDHTDHDLVADETSGIHDLLGLATEGCLRSNLCAEHVSGSLRRLVPLHLLLPAFVLRL